MSMPTVAVIRGGASSAFATSLESGATILDNLSHEKYTVRDIYIDRTGKWIERGRVTSPQTVLQQTDIVLNTLHGSHQIHNQVGQWCDRYKVCVVGTPTLSVAMASHPLHARSVAHQANIPTVKSLIIRADDDVTKILHTVMRQYSQPIVVSSVRQSPCEIGEVTYGFPSLSNSVIKCIESGDDAIVEECSGDTRASVGIIENFRGEKLYALIPQFIGKTNSRNLFEKGATATLLDYARRMHQELQLKHYSESFFYLTKSGVVYVGTSTRPKLTKDAPFVRSLHAIGSSVSEFLNHCIDCAYRK